MGESKMLGLCHWDGIVVVTCCTFRKSLWSNLEKIKIFKIYYGNSYRKIQGIAVIRYYSEFIFSSDEEFKNSGFL